MSLCLVFSMLGVKDKVVDFFQKWTETSPKVQFGKVVVKTDFLRDLFDHLAHPSSSLSVCSVS